MVNKNRELLNLSGRIDLLVGFTASKVNKEERTSALYEIIRDQETRECKQYIGISGFNGPDGNLSSVLYVHLNPKSQLLEVIYLPNAEYTVESTGKEIAKQSEEHSESQFRVEQCNGVYEMIDGKGRVVTNRETIDSAVNTVLDTCASMLQKMDVEEKIKDYLKQRGFYLDDE